MQLDILKKIGFSDKSATVYLALISLGPSSVRKLAEFCDLNRGTTYDTLKWLQNERVVTFYQKDTKQYFVAEKPEKLIQLVQQRKKVLEESEKDLEKQIPELDALYNKGGERPVARYYEKDELQQILQDVLDTCEHTEEHSYRVYSASSIRPYLYKDFPTFSDVRVAKGIKVKVIAIGEGGELRGLDERKWLDGDGDTKTCIIIYPGKTAYISLNTKKEAIGVVIENTGVYETQKMIFDQLWITL